MTSSQKEIRSMMTELASMLIVDQTTTAGAPYVLQLNNDDGESDLGGPTVEGSVMLIQSKDRNVWLQPSPTVLMFAEYFGVTPNCRAGASGAGTTPSFSVAGNRGIFKFESDRGSPDVYLADLDTENSRGPRRRKIVFLPIRTQSHSGAK